MSELDQIKDYVDAITKLLSQLEQAALHDAVTVSNWDHDSAYNDSRTIPEKYLQLKRELDDSYRPSQITECILKLEGPLGKQIDKSHDELYSVCLSSYPSLVDAMERITASAVRKAAYRLRELAKEGRVSHNVRELFWDITMLDPTDYDVDSDGQPVQVKCSFQWCFPGNPDWQGELGTALSAIKKRIPKLEALAPTTGTPNSDAPWQVPSHVQWSDTFTTLDIAGTTYKFSPIQSYCMEVMLKAYEVKGQTVFSSNEVLESVDRDLKSKRLRDVFKHSQFWQDGRMKTAPNARGCVKINLEKKLD